MFRAFDIIITAIMKGYNHIFSDDQQKREAKTLQTVRDKQN